MYRDELSQMTDIELDEFCSLVVHLQHVERTDMLLKLGDVTKAAAAFAKNDLRINSTGTQYWYRNGKFHRTDGPAIIWADGVQEWWENGQLKEIK